MEKWLLGRCEVFSPSFQSKSRTEQKNFWCDAMLSRILKTLQFNFKLLTSARIIRSYDISADLSSSQFPEKLLTSGVFTSWLFFAVLVSLWQICKLYSVHSAVVKWVSTQGRRRQQELLIFSSHISEQIYEVCPHTEACIGKWMDTTGQQK